MHRPVILGTRGSELALIQARMVETALREQWPELRLETQIVRTSGDEGVVKTSVPPEAGRKGLFTAEIERSLTAEQIDVAVHSAKDLPSSAGPGTEIAAVLPRAAADDVLVSANNYDLESLPRNALVATGSVRRRHQLRWKRPDLTTTDLRGNVPTRLGKLIRQSWDGAVFARAGLQRLGLISDRSDFEFEGCRLFIFVLDSNVFVPAGGQGIVAVQIRSGDEATRKFVKSIDHIATNTCLKAEREFLRLLNADCDQPVGVSAIVSGDELKMRGQVFDLESTVPREATVKGPVEEPEQLAANLLVKINGR